MTGLPFTGPQLTDSAGTIPVGPALERLGVRLYRVNDGGLDATELLGLALRRNPRRAQLLVSRVLGKHVPTDPRLVRAAGLLLGGLVADALARRPPRPLPGDLMYAAIRREPGAAAALHAAAVAGGDGADVLVLGFAETATALGHCVAEALGGADGAGADYLHSTRRPVAGVGSAGGFREEHSHATEHLLLPQDPALLSDPRPLVLVDDELSTGRTALNTITALHRVAPRERYVVAALVDVRTAGSGPDSAAGSAGGSAVGSAGDGPGASELVDGVAALGARVDVVSLARARVAIPADVSERAEDVRREHPVRTESATRPPAEPDSRVGLGGLGWPAGVPAGGRHGFSATDHRRLAVAWSGIGARVAAAAGMHAGGMRPGGMHVGGTTLVLGTEELMAVPLRLAQVLADSGHDVSFSTTTRSPAVVIDEPGYALRNGITFPAHDDPADGPGPRFAYNLGTGRPWDRILVVVDPPADTPALRAGLLAALAPHTRRTVLVVTP